MKKAFTLIELLTVLIIIVIVLAIAVPVVNSLINGVDLATGTNKIKAMLYLARQDAIYNRARIGVFFYTDAKTQRTAMAEIQVENLCYIQPGTRNYAMFSTFFIPFSPQIPWSPMIARDGVNALELVSSANPQSFFAPFLRDVVLLPRGVSVALTNNTYTYNVNANWNRNPNNLPPLDRYVRIGCIMFDPFGNLISLPYGIPLNDPISAVPPLPADPTSTKSVPNQLCKLIGMYGNDFASAEPSPPAQKFPLVSSVGFVIYDQDQYVSQHANQVVLDNFTNIPTHVTLGIGEQFNNDDLTYSLTNVGIFIPPLTTTDERARLKYLEESWIDNNGTAYLINPTNGSLVH